MGTGHDGLVFVYGLVSLAERTPAWAGDVGSNPARVISTGRNVKAIYI